MINASVISGPKKRQCSSNDTRVVHPYVVNARTGTNDKTPWTTSKITRNKDGTIKIKIFQK